MLISDVYEKWMFNIENQRKTEKTGAKLKLINIFDLF